VELQVSDIEFNNKNKRKQDIKIIYEQNAGIREE
jgi:hypothetical protein